MIVNSPLAGMLRYTRVIAVENTYFQLEVLLAHICAVDAHICAVDAFFIILATMIETRWCGSQGCRIALPGRDSESPPLRQQNVIFELSGPDT